MDDHLESLRITEKIATFGSPTQRRGMRELEQRLRREGVPAGVRLRYLSALVHMSHEAAETLPRRVRDAERRTLAA